MEKYIKSFWNKVAKLDKCWEWQACLNEAGYGMIGVGDKKVERAHRFSYRLHIGEIPNGMFVCHKCDNRKCVNPEHLFLGTNSDNVKDMFDKKRNKKPPSMGGWNICIYDNKIIEMLGKIADTKIAIIAGVSKHAIQRERKRRNIKPFPCQTKFAKGNPHPRWHKKIGG